MEQCKCEGVWQVQEEKNNKGLCDQSKSCVEVYMRDGTEKSIPFIEKLIAKAYLSWKKAR